MLPDSSLLSGAFYCDVRARWSLAGVQPLHHFKAGAAVVVGALPGAHFVFALRSGTPVSRDPPEPLAILVIDDVLVDERPASFGGIKKVLLAGELRRR